MSRDTIKNLEPVPSADDTLLDTPATAERVIAARKSIQVSQKTLAMEMGISQPYLCDLESSRRRWSLKVFNDAKAALERLSV